MFIIIIVLVKSCLILGVPELDMPPLDPMVMDVLKFSYKSSMVGGDTVVRDVGIQRLSTIKVIETR